MLHSQNRYWILVHKNSNNPTSSLCSFAVTFSSPIFNHPVAYLLFKKREGDKILLPFPGICFYTKFYVKKHTILFCRYSVIMQINIHLVATSHSSFLLSSCSFTFYYWIKFSTYLMSLLVIPTMQSKPQELTWKVSLSFIREWTLDIFQVPPKRKID